MEEIIRQFGVTAILMCVIVAGGKKSYAYLIGIYGGSYMVSSIIKFILPLFQSGHHILF